MNENETTPAPDMAGSTIERDKPEIEQAAASRARVARAVILVGGIIFCAMLVVYVVAYLFLEITNWQVLADSAGVILTLAFLGLAYWSVRQGKIDAAGHWVLIALIESYVVSEALWVGETIYNAISGTLLILLLGRILLPRKWPRWLLAAGVCLICILLINLWAPDFRCDATLEAPGWIYVDVGITGLLVLAALWQLIRTVAVGKIRIRLLVAFVLVVLLLAGSITAASALLGVQNGRQQAFNNLTLAASFKEDKIGAWLSDLQADLDIVVSDEVYLLYADIVMGDEQVSATARANAFASLYLRFLEYTRPPYQFEEVYLLDKDGEVVVSTSRQLQNTFLSQEVYFQAGLDGPHVELAPDPRSPDRRVLIVARPAVGPKGETIGVLVASSGITTLEAIAREEIGLGETENAYLVADDYTVVVTLHPDEEIDGEVHSYAIDRALGEHIDGVGGYTNHRGVPVLGAYRWVQAFSAALLVEQEQDEVFASVYGTVLLNAGVALVAALLAIVASLVFTRGIVRPLAKLAETASQIAAGDLDRTAEVAQSDEIGGLARAFNDMTARLREQVGSLEERVAVRTLELERHSTYLEASAEVARAASSILDIDQLIQQVVELIRRRFSLYYVGLFLVDEIGEWAELRAGTGEAGKAMLARSHRVRIGEGMVGWCVANGESRVALDVGEDAVRLATDELPETRSEAALPLRTRGRVVGALTVQSDQPAAFDQETIAVFQSMADQIAIALENARLFAASQTALDAAGRAYGELSREAWISLLQARPDIGYRSDEHGVIAFEGTWRPEMTQALQEKKVVQGDGAGEEEKIPLAVPIKVRGEVIGVLDTHKPTEEGGWTDEEIALLEALTDQLGEALEGARLYRDTQRRAAREQLVSHVVNRMRSAVDMETLMQTTIREVATILGVSSAFVQLGLGSETAGDEEDGEPRTGQ